MAKLPNYIGMVEGGSPIPKSPKLAIFGACLQNLQIHLYNASGIGIDWW